MAQVDVDLQVETEERLAEEEPDQLLLQSQLDFERAELSYPASLRGGPDSESDTLTGSSLGPAAPAFRYLPRGCIAPQRLSSEPLPAGFQHALAVSGTALTDLASGNSSVERFLLRATVVAHLIEPSAVAQTSGSASDTPAFRPQRTRSSAISVSASPYPPSWQPSPSF